MSSPVAERPAVSERRGGALIGDDAVASILLRQKLVPTAEVERAFAQASKQGRFVEEILIERGALSAEDARASLQAEHGCVSADLVGFAPDPEAFALVPRHLALRHLVVPLRIEGTGFTAAVPDPADARLREALESFAGRPVRLVVALRHELRQVVESASDLYATGVERARPAAPSSTPSLAPVPPPAPALERPSAPVRARLPVAAPAAAKAQPPVDLHDATLGVNAMLRRAVDLGATDIHVEPGENALAVRFRIDGILRRVATAPKELAGSITSRLKVLGRLDIAERRSPQDGRATLTYPDLAVDLRISSLPSAHGETIVMRLLRKDTNLLDVDKLAMPEAIRARHQESIDAPMGLFLVTGPTGSGKTTTLYATLAAIDRETHSVVTLEDPIEYSLPGITQVQIHDASGMTFDAGLRSILRQDPDVILVGEIRDVATAEIACRAALTGHKVFSTLHTNDACQAVTRLLEMGVSPHLVAATLKAVIAQRLLRKSCAACRRPRPATEVERKLLHAPELTEVTEGAGCPTCLGSGYRGRMAVHEHFRVDGDVQRLVLERASALQLRHVAQRAGMATMVDAGRRLVVSGETTPLEVQRVLLADESRGAPCPSCARPVEDEYAVCPYCSHALRQDCTRCAMKLEPEWAACPRCGTAAGGGRGRAHCGRCAATLDHDGAACPYCATGPS